MNSYNNHICFSLYTVVKILAGIFIILFAAACDFFSIKHEELTLERQENNSRKLRLDGYYYVESEGPGEKSISVYFFFQDGTFMSLGGIWEEDFPILNQRLRNPEYVNRLTNRLDSFGVYRISDDSIVCQELASIYGNPPRMRLNSKGVILNDTTFLTTRYEVPTNGERFDVRRIYHFRRFVPKLDSLKESYHD